MNPQEKVDPLSRLLKANAHPPAEPTAPSANSANDESMALVSQDRPPAISHTRRRLPDTTDTPSVTGATTDDINGAAAIDRGAASDSSAAADNMERARGDRVTQHARPDDATSGVIASADNNGVLLEGLAPAIDRARSFAERWPVEYRTEIFRVALGHLLSSEGSHDGHISDPAFIAALGAVRSTTMHSASPSSVEPSSPGVAGAVGPTEKLARHLKLSTDALRRTVHFEDGGRVAILGRIEGRSRREHQLKYSMVYLYVKELALATRLVDVDELRALCVQHGCYDQANFTANFRREAARVREDGTKGAHTRRYMLTQRGMGEAESLLREMVNQ